MQKRALLIDSEVTAGIIEIRGEMQKKRAFVAGVSLPLFLSLQTPYEQGENRTVIRFGR